MSFWSQACYKSLKTGGGTKKCSARFIKPLISNTIYGIVLPLCLKGDAILS
jgi:hypothetical protein